MIAINLLPHARYLDKAEWDRRRVAINLRRWALTTGLFPARCRPDTAEATGVRVQFWRVIGGTRVQAPVVHRVGYQATPDAAAALCSAGGGPYGRLVRIRPGRPLGTVGRQRILLCPRCEKIYTARWRPPAPVETQP